MTVGILTFHLGLDELNEGLTPRENPAIHDVLASETLGVVLEIDTLVLLEERGLTEEETVRVEEREENVRDDILDTLLLESERITANDGGVDQEETESVGTVSVDDQVGVGVVFERFRHLFAVGREDVTADDQVLPRRGAEKVRRKDEERVEPSTSLVHRLGDEVGRERLFELLLVLEGVVNLSIRHAVIVDERVNFQHLQTKIRQCRTHLPDSNQQSKTSSTRLRSPLPCLLGIVIWSILSRWRSVMPLTPESSSSCSIEEMQTICCKYPVSSGSRKRFFAKISSADTPLRSRHSPRAGAEYPSTCSSKRSSRGRSPTSSGIGSLRRRREPIGCPSCS